MSHKEIIVKLARLLDKSKIPYMLIGGQAVLLHGMVRLTEDIDITLGVDVDKLEFVKKILKDGGLIIPGNVDDVFVKKTNVLIGVDKTTGIRIDFIFSFTAYEQSAIKRAKKIKMDNFNIHFATCEDTIIHKMFASRPRDLEDVKVLLEINRKKLDLKYVRKCLKEFSDAAGHDLLKDFIKLSKLSRY